MLKTKKSDYEVYLEKYCRTYGYPPEVAKEHYLVKEYEKYCKERESGRISEGEEI